MVTLLVILWLAGLAEFALGAWYGSRYGMPGGR